MNKLFLWIAAASAFVLQSCENTDGIRDEIGSLRDRVIALEAKIGSVNTSIVALHKFCLLYTSPSPRDRTRSRMPSSA